MGLPALSPNCPAAIAAWRASPAAIRAFDGTHPALRQSPPMRCLSTRTTGTPNDDAIAATDSPADPAPTMHRSGVRTSLIATISLAIGLGCRPVAVEPFPVAPEVLHGNGRQGQDAQQHESCDDL